MTEIKAIQTEYKGYKFRSRLEARWAIFFDTLGLGWEYEKEGFCVDGKPYLPDFWIRYAEPSQIGWGFHLEIKPHGFDPNSTDLYKKLAQQTGHSTFLIIGNPYPNEHVVYGYSHTRNREQRFSIGEFTVNLNGHYDWRDNKWKMHHHITCTGSTNMSHPFNGPYGSPEHFLIDLLKDAFLRARQARFEHGETPQ